MATTDTNKQSLEEHRVTMLEELGFSNEEATKLDQSYRTSVVKGKKRAEDRRYEIRVDHHYVRKLLDAGATKDQVLRILL